MEFRVVVALILVVPPATLDGQQGCRSLTQLQIPRVQVTSAVPVAAGPFKRPPGTDSPVPGRLPAHCRVQGIARPTSDSEIRFEVWLPVAARWNGKFQQQGNGGYAGTIPVGPIAAALARGYASAGTDDGHTGHDPKFAIGHPERVVDFGHRAVHETAIAAKAVIAAHYGKPPARSYFVGCSDGGREALMEAQRYPQDFHGIIAGAPANDWTRLMTSGVWIWKALNETPGSAIPTAKLGLIQRAVMDSCDRTDGVTDGLIEDPRRCRIVPKRLECSGDDRPTCLTAEQVVALEKIYQGPKNPRTGERIYPGAVPGGEGVNSNWDLWLVASKENPLPVLAWFGTTYYQSMVYANPTWDFRNMDFDRDVATALEKVEPNVGSTNPDLRPFRDRGGKLIQYHGWSDAAIVATGSIDYYEQVVAKIGGSVDDFYRLFMVPGMGHCAYGVGPNEFGNYGTAEALATDPDRHIVAALERWVEKGVAPDRLLAKGIRPGATPTAKPIPITRPLCAYPKTAQYRGTGSTDDATNFACR